MGLLDILNNPAEWTEGRAHQRAAVEECTLGAFRRDLHKRRLSQRIREPLLISRARWPQYLIAPHHFAPMINTQLGDAAIEFVRTHEIWAAPTVFGLAFLESFAFLSLLVPATVILFGISGILGAASVEFWPILHGRGFGRVCW
jgi:hypothetical protein